jgi:hypothetical protein
MHHEGGSWTAVRTHTPSKFSKVRTEPLAPIPLDHSKFRENGSQPSMIPWLPSPHHLKCREAVWQVPARSAVSGRTRACHLGARVVSGDLVQGKGTGADGGHRVLLLPSLSGRRLLATQSTTSTAPMPP